MAQVLYEFYNARKREILNDNHFMRCPIKICIAISLHRKNELASKIAVRGHLAQYKEIPWVKAHGPMEQETPSVMCIDFCRVLREMFTTAFPHGTLEAFITFIRCGLRNYIWSISLYGQTLLENLNLRDVAFVTDACAHYVFSCTDLTALYVDGGQGLQWKFYKCSPVEQHSCHCYL